MILHPDAPVGAIATEHPLATRVFARHAIDFCCGGGRALGETCAERGMDVAAILKEIEAEIADATVDPVRWDRSPLNELIEHILEVYHAPLREELPRIEAMARKVLEVHRDKDPERLEGIVQTFASIRADIEPHLIKEEEILFPMILAGHGRQAMGPISVMEMEHEALGGLLHKLRELCNDYVVPEEACNTWRALWAALEDLERATHEHIHLENNILHRRALAG